MNTTCDACKPLLDEYRAEVRALRIVLAAVEKKRGQQGCLVEFSNDGTRAFWVITCTDRGSQRLIADAVAEHIADQLSGAVRLTNLFLRHTGSDADMEPESSESAKHPDDKEQRT